MTRPTRIVTDTMAGLRMPDFDIWSERVSTVLGQNPGPFTGPGTNTYLIGGGPRNEWAVIDPGPLDQAHVDAIIKAALERWFGGSKDDATVELLRRV